MGLDFREFDISKGNTVERVAFFLELLIGKDFLLDTPFFAQMLGDVVSNAVLEYTDNSFGLVVLPSLLLDKLLGSPED